MKTRALMLFGDPRYCKECIESIKKNMCLNDFDVYGFFWIYSDAPEIGINNETYIKKKETIFKKQHEFVDKIKQSINFIALETKEPPYFPLRFKNGPHEEKVIQDTQSDPVKYNCAVNKDLQGQWAAQYYCYQLIEKKTQLEKKTYDCILRMRLDMSLCRPLSLPENFDFVHIPTCEATYFYDHIYCSNQANMKIICDFYLCLENVLMSYSYHSVTQGEVHLARFVKSCFPPHVIKNCSFGQPTRLLCNHWFV